MSVIAIIVLGVVAVLLLAMLLAGVRRSGDKRRLALAVARRGADVHEPRSRAEESRNEAALRNGG